ncbi:hypothetical protein LXL04_009404 [Taraxacum kok-saghyz]
MTEYVVTRWYRREMEKRDVLWTDRFHEESPISSGEAEKTEESPISCELCSGAAAREKKQRRQGSREEPEVDERQKGQRGEVEGCCLSLCLALDTEGKD